MGDIQEIVRSLMKQELGQRKEKKMRPKRFGYISYGLICHSNDFILETSGSRKKNLSK